ncbi:hypothetical protein CLNEO_24760 [Anaerotignum neopropionicum]|uniref:Uncharacterized protein n=1 Tax=Anaerotignum neopropionicum TaxID=36847 RepID=A0A136WC81_9FIRM|nr:hypothetical protein [Anaerotignum neopropionicum]KXL52127.1 hypothetical protein CLNEO_24760 [Anaerotignum neopropionicum]
MNCYKSRTMLLSGMVIRLFVLLVGEIMAKTWMFVVGAIIVIAEMIEFSILTNVPVVASLFLGLGGRFLSIVHIVEKSCISILYEGDF